MSGLSQPTVLSPQMVRDCKLLKLARVAAILGWSCASLKECRGSWLPHPLPLAVGTYIL
jgi:hypothetical protein